MSESSIFIRETTLLASSHAAVARFLYIYDICSYVYDKCEYFDAVPTEITFYGFKISRCC